MEKLKINHAAVWVGVVVLFALGFVWYNLLFGEQWLEFVGLDMVEVEANPPGYGIWISNLIASALGMYLLAWLFEGLNITSGSKGAIVGFLIAFIFIFLSTMVNNMYAHSPYGLAWITGGFSMVGFTINGFILGAWTKKK
jgi:hypothetical protein